MKQEPTLREKLLARADEINDTYTRSLLYQAALELEKLEKQEQLGQYENGDSSRKPFVSRTEKKPS